MGRNRLKVIRDIFWTFLKIGPATFGGGYAMLPIIEREVTVKRAWIPEKDIANLISIAGSAPGGIGVNASAFIGYRLAGIPGTVAAVIGITLPTFLIALLLSLAFSYMQGNAKVEAALVGIHAAIIGLIALAAYNMGKSAIFDKTTLITSLSTLIILLSFPIHPLYVILVGLFIGIILVKVKEAIGLQVRLEKGDQVQVSTLGKGYANYEYFFAEGI
ncbi:chromate transporter [Paenibacillus sp. LMG 31460]|uniref:Chromate transporter n=1 Tax=Paenibacillus germinis TaxID=2654979 RepID=A0ABX1YWE6_9BACL|nr:chromate transporter [Paenibacillus germinis]NOU85440.1 chromate transporter [Paenibacillus germinis]